MQKNTLNIAEFLAPATMGALSNYINDLRNNAKYISNQVIKPYLDIIEKNKNIYSQIINSISSGLNIKSMTDQNQVLINSIKGLTNSNLLLKGYKINNSMLNSYFNSIDFNVLNQQFEALYGNINNAIEIINSDSFVKYFAQLQELSDYSYKENKIFNEQFINEVIESEIVELNDSMNDFSFTKDEQLFLKENPLSNILINSNYDINVIQNNKKLSESFKSYLIKLKELIFKWITLKKVLIVILMIYSFSSDTISWYEFLKNPDILPVKIGNNQLNKDDFYYISVKKAIVRNDSKKNSEIICNLLLNHKLKKIDTNGNWILVEFNQIINDNEVTQSGWINKSSVRKIK